VNIKITIYQNISDYDNSKFTFIYVKYKKNKTKCLKIQEPYTVKELGLSLIKLGLSLNEI
jgi:hypothetical protein